MTSTALTTYAQSSLSERQEYARLLATAGDMIPRALRDANNTPNLGKVLLVMETGAMLGIHPVAALQGVNVIEGKATLSAALMSALIRRAGHRLSIVVAGTIEGGDLAATVTLTRADTEESFTSVWTPKRAHQAGLCLYTQKDGVWSVSAKSQSGAAKPWQSYTAQLCKARAISEVYIEGATDLAMGAIYTPEEMGDTDEYEQGESVAAASAIVSPPREADDKWVDDIADASTLDELREVWEHARAQGVLADTLGEGTVRQALEDRSEALKDSPGEDVATGGINDAQAATIGEWADMLEWNSRAVMAHIRKVIGDHVNDVLDLTEADAVRVIASMSAKAEQVPEAKAEQAETLI